MGWISVRDEMPKSNKYVLVIDANKEKSICYSNGHNEWKYSGCYDDCCGCNAPNITHWMELPGDPG